MTDKVSIILTLGKEGKCLHCALYLTSKLQV